MEVLERTSAIRLFSSLLHSRACFSSAMPELNFAHASTARHTCSSSSANCKTRHATLSQQKVALQDEWMMEVHTHVVGADEADDGVLGQLEPAVATDARLGVRFDELVA